MSDAANPYQAPLAPGESIQQNAAVSGGMTAKTVEYLGIASPWARFLGILGFILCGLFGLFGLLAMALMGTMGIFGRGLEGPVLEASRTSSLVLGLLYIALGVVGIFPSRYSYLIGNAMRKIKTDPNSENLEVVAKNLKSIIRFFGIYMIIAIGLGIIGFFVAIGISVSTALNAIR